MSSTQGRDAPALPPPMLPKSLLSTQTQSSDVHVVVSTSSKKRKNKKKRKKNNNSATTTLIAADGSTNNDTQQQNNTSNNNNDTITILQSKLSSKKRLYLKKSTKQTPWYDANELLDAGRGLLLALKLFPSPTTTTTAAAAAANQYQHDATTSSPKGLVNEEYAQLEMALHRVAIWRGRSSDRHGGRLSHAIDMTAGLAGILLLDAESSPSSAAVYVTPTTTTTTMYQLRNTYATLLLRSVNGLADTYRHQRKSASLSVSHCCALAGLPLWIVDIRHDASHNELPSLGVCRIGALESLKFWGGRYWDGLEEKVWGAVKVKDESKERNDCSNNDDVVGLDNGGEEDVLNGGICTLAMDCLVKYQTSAVRECREREDKARDQQKQRKGTVGKKESKEEVVPSNENEQDNMTPMQEDDVDAPPQHHSNRGVIPWGILNDDDKPRKKKKKANKISSNDSNVANNESMVMAGDAVNTPSADTSMLSSGNVKQCDTRTQTPPATAKPLSATTSTNIPSSRDCAAEFVRTIPIDIAYSMALRFLVWGRSSSSLHNSKEGDTAGGGIMNGPALVTLPRGFGLSSHHLQPTTTMGSTLLLRNKLELDASFQQLRTMYDPLLIAMANVYPGFLVALFVHLSDSILCLDDARQQQQRQLLVGHNADDDGTCDDETTLDMKQLEYHIQHLSRWVRYIFSREYHMHFDRSVAVYLPSEDVQREESEQEQLLLPQQPPIDLKKKGRKKWTAAQLGYMQSSLDYSYLREIGFPLNSVCDRLLLSHQKDVAKGSNSVRTNIVGDLQQYLEDIIGKERVFFMGIDDHKDTDVLSSSERDHPSKEKDLTEDEGKSSQRIIVPARANNDKDGYREETTSSRGPTTPTTPNPLSLKDMEAMFADTDDAANNDNDGASSSHAPDKHDAVDHCADSSSSKGPTSLFIKPWTLCDSWDACAIGTMPGYPS